MVNDVCSDDLFLIEAAAGAQVDAGPDVVQRLVERGYINASTGALTAEGEDRGRRLTPMANDLRRLTIAASKGGFALTTDSGSEVHIGSGGPVDIN